MTESKLDPRIIRTRRLIMDAFIRLSRAKAFNKITIKDITDEATINRATFYYHFVDKYELLERVIAEDMIPNVIGQIYEHKQLTEETITEIFLAITDFQSSVKTQCMRSFEAFKSTIEKVLIKELEQFFFMRLLERMPHYPEEDLRIASAMLSWAIYGALVNWEHHDHISAEDYIRRALPFISQGIGFLDHS